MDTSEPSDAEEIVERPRRRRHTARVLMIDPQDRLLLLRDSDPYLPQYRFWITPGGGIDPGEDERQAAVREVREETGIHISIDDLIWPLARRHVVHGYSDTIDEQDEAFYLVSVPTSDIDISGHSEQEQATLVEHRWWSVAELAATDEWIWPARLLDILNADPHAPLDLGSTDEESTLAL